MKRAAQWIYVWIMSFVVIGYLVIAGFVGMLVWRDRGARASHAGRGRAKVRVGSNDAIG